MIDENKRKILSREVRSLEQLINAYLSLNPNLNDIELDKLTFKIKNKNVREDTVKRKCRICIDENGNEYCYYGPNGCP